MTTEYKYDAFISYSRKDYVDETTQEAIPDNPISAIKEAFDKSNITYWFDEEGIYSGQAFVDIITEAIAVSKTFVFISSKHSNRSKWTKSEILEAFDSDKIIIPFKIDDTEYDKSLKFFLRPLDFISYHENKEKAIEELIRSVNKVKDEIAEEEEKKQAEAKLIRIKEKIKELVEDYQRLSSQQETILSDIVGQSQLLGIDNKKCPICEKLSKIEALFCDRCGWTFHPLFALDETHSFVSNRIQLSIFKAQWKSISRIEEAKRELESLTSENEQLKESIEKMSEECRQHLETIERNKHAFEQKEKENEHRLSIQLQESQKKVLALNDEIKLLKEQAKKAEKLWKAAQVSLQEANVSYNHLQVSYNELQIDYNKVQEELNMVQKELKAARDRVKTGQIPSTAPINKRKSKIKSSIDVSNILKRCKKRDYYLDIFTDDSVIKTIDVTFLQSVLKDDYGINITLESILSCGSISVLKSLILSKAGIS